MPHWKYAGRAAAVLLGAFLVAAGAFVAAAPSLLAWAVAHPLSRWAGRSIAIEGPIRIAWGDKLRISGADFHIANAPWAARPDMLTAQRVALEIPWSSLLKGAPRIARLSLENAYLFLETSGHGQHNWDFLTAPLRAPDYGFAPPLDLVRLRDATVSFRGGASGREAALTLAALDVTRDPDGSLRLAASGQLLAKPARFTAVLGPVAELRHPSQPYPVRFAAVLGDSRFDLAGSAAQPLNLIGVVAHVTLSGGSDIGAAMPWLADLHAAGDLAGDGAAWSLRHATARAQAGAVNGDLSLDLGGTIPLLRGNLSTAALDLRTTSTLLPQLASALAATRRAAEARRVIPDLPLPSSSLGDLAAQLAFAGARVIAPSGLPLEQLNIGLQLKDGALVVNPLRFHVSGGDIDAEMNLDTRVRPPHIALKIDLAGVDLAELARQSHFRAPFAGLAGTLGSKLRLDGSGGTLREAVAHLDGEADLVVAQGRIDHALAVAAGPALEEALVVAGSSSAVLPLDCLAARFIVRKGVATAATLLADSGTAILAGRGDINLAAETFYVDVTPTEKRADGPHLRAPIELRGTFTEPMLLVSQAGATGRTDLARSPPPRQSLIEGGPDASNTCAPAGPTHWREPASGSTVPGGRQAAPSR